MLFGFIFKLDNLLFFEIPIYIEVAFVSAALRLNTGCCWSWLDLPAESLLDIPFGWGLDA